MGILRFLLAVSVVLVHTEARYTMVDAKVAVEAFYMISGFYMALVLDGRYTNVYTFWTNRLIRLLPGYWIVAVVTAALLWKTRPSFFSDLTPYEAVVNFTIAGQDLLLFGAGHWQSLLVPQAWSIALELYFYALAPFLVRRSTPTLVALLALSLALRVIGYAYGYSEGPWRYRFFPFELALFVAGILAYRVTWRLPTKRAPLLAVAAILTYPLLNPYVAPFFMLALIWFLLPHIFAASNAVDRWIGELSYPIYINHILVMLVCGARPIIVLSWSVVMGAITAVTIEAPLSRWRARRLFVENVDRTGVERVASVVSRDAHPV